MKAKIVIVVFLILTVVVTFSLPPLAATPNSNTPSYSVLTALQGIKDAVTSLAAAEAAPEANSVAVAGYCIPTVIAEDSNQVVFTVPAGRQFVLRKLYVRHSDNFIRDYWHLSVDGDVLIDGGIVYESNGIKKGTHNFPDNCVVIDAGKTLSAVNEMSEDGTYTLKTTIIGYFRDTQ